VVGIFEPRRLSPAAETLDAASDGYLSTLIRRGDIEGQLGQNLLLHNVPGSLADRVLLVIDAGKTRRDQAERAKELLEKANVRIIGAALANTIKSQFLCYPNGCPYEND